MAGIIIGMVGIIVGMAADYSLLRRFSPCTFVLFLTTFKSVSKDLIACKVPYYGS
jgi:hypothetical protein